MSQPAARLGDACDHGGKVEGGAATVFIEDLPATTVTHGHSCPIHAPGVVMQGSLTVFWEDNSASRKGDDILCGPAPHVRGGTADCAVTASPLGMKLLCLSPAGDGDVGGEFVALDLVDVQAEAQLGNLLGVGGSMDVDVGRAAGSYTPGGDGLIPNFSSKISSAEGSGAAWIGPASDFGANPYIRWDLYVDGPSADAGLNRWMFSSPDGKRYGFQEALNLHARMFEIAERVTVTIPVWPGYNVQGNLFAGGKAAAVGGAYDVHGYWDTETDRLYLGAMLDAAFGFGGQLGAGLSIGRSFDPSVTPAIDEIISGAATVFVGG